MNDAQPRFKFHSRNTVRKDCLKIYKKGKDELFAVLSGLSGRVSFTADLWTSPSGTRGFMSVTGHFIDGDWKLKKRVLGFVPVPTPHTGKQISDSLLHVIMSWNFDKKVFCLTLDNASSNDACVRELLQSNLVLY